MREYKLYIINPTKVKNDKLERSEQMTKAKYLVAFALIMILGANMLFASKTDVQMKLWNRWTYETSDGEVQENQFSLSRGYFRINHYFTDDIKGRFNVDIFSDDDANDGAGLKLKYAYLDFKNLLPMQGAKLTIGLMKTYFGTIYSWDYPTIAKDPTDMYKISSSTDYGLGISGDMPSNLGEYNLAMYNGEGYKKTGSDVNKYPAFVGNARFNLMKNIMLGGSAYLANKTGTTEPYDEKTAFAGIANLQFGPVDFWGEYLMKNVTVNSKSSDETKSAGFMLMPIIELTPYLELVLRYDQWDPNTDMDDDAYNLMVGGVNFKISEASKGVMLQLNYENKSFEDDSMDSISKIVAQLRWAFSTPKL